MRIALLSLALCLTASLPAYGQTAGGAASPPVPIEEWSLQNISTAGLEIYRQDSAAWVATDALTAAVSQDEARTIRGWLMTPVEGGLAVHFYRQGDPDPVPGWTVVVSRGVAGPVVPSAEPSLTPEQLAQARAVATARANVGQLRCSSRLNTAIMRDPDSDAWLVWLLTPMPENRQIPIGGHYRFRISADGTSVLRRDQLSNSCLFLDRPQGGRDAMLMTTQIVSKSPVETHVFLSIQNQITIVVMAGDRFFSVGGARVSDITDQVGRR